MDPSRFHAPAALVGESWQRDVRIDVDARGFITALAFGVAPEGCERLRGPVIPAMSNAHSHAFQRALVGMTGRLVGEDSFWTWREAMYAFVARLDPDALEAVTAQAYVEMVEAGYAAVAEFHYVHADADGRPYANVAELAHRVVAAAQRTGIALTLLPVAYAHAGFGGTAPRPLQKRFVLERAHYEALVAQLADTAARDDVVVGVAPHSLRAVTPALLHQVLDAAPPDAPIHIHVSEQRREVADCLAWSGQRPVDWLLDHAPVDARWALVHATHADAREIARIAASGATVVLAPTTEGDLGDGTFLAERYVGCGGALAIGSDSNTIIDPFAELRQLEYSQRIATGRRNVLAHGDVPVGAALWAAAAAGGARALARPLGSIATGRRADLVVLDVDEPALAERAPDAMLEAAIFGPARRPVRDVLIGGRMVVRDGRHVHRDAVFRAWRATLARILAA
ncbi:MAG: formimidoylglutamate deiminase [Proteobacteria bacterium]|nr:formimidoylglutamate deiminase [Pseudomonadota bacterium]